MTIKLSVIIVNYNTRKLVLQCIRSIANRIDRRCMEIIVVDNGSHDDSVSAIRAAFPYINIVENSQNRGFAYANNQGIKRASGDYVLLLNSDTVVCENVLCYMLRYMDSHQSVGVAGCKLLNADGSLQPSIGSFPHVLNDLIRLFFHVNSLQKNKLAQQIIARFFPFLLSRGLGRFSDHSREQRAQYLVGAFLLVRRVAMDQVGELDEVFFFLAEEADWCFRFWQAGWEVVYVPDVSVVHLGGATSDQEFTERRFIQRYKSRLHYYRKHDSNLSVLIYRIGVYLALISRSFFLTLKIFFTKNHAKKHAEKRREIYMTTAKMMFCKEMEMKNVLYDLKLRK